jgi:hypothetical protein
MLYHVEEYKKGYYHFLKLGQTDCTFICANHSYLIQSTIACFSAGRSVHGTETQYFAQAALTNSTGLNGGVVFHSGVDFVLIFNGVVGEA